MIYIYPKDNLLVLKNYNAHCLYLEIYFNNANWQYELDNEEHFLLLSITLYSCAKKKWIQCKCHKKQDFTFGIILPTILENVLPASFRLAWRLCVWKCSWTNSCYRSYEYTSCEIFACNSLFKLNIVQRVKMYFCFLAKLIIINWSSFLVIPINVRRIFL